MIMSKYIFPLLIVLTGLTHSQSNSINLYHPFSNKIIISSEFGFTHSYTDYLYPQPELLGRGTIEYFFPSRSTHAFGIKLIGSYGNLSSFGRVDKPELVNQNFKTSITTLGTGISYARMIGYSMPYLSVTISRLLINPKDQSGKLLPNNFDRKYDIYQSMYTLEFGIRFIVEDFWSVNLGANLNITNSDFLDDLEYNNENDRFMTLFFGLSLYHGGNRDSDNDGIEDNKDICPETPKGLIVNTWGCPEDSDSDGVPDYLDECPNTPRNILITETGCPQDMDKDGIPDYADKCPDSPLGHSVDSNGCLKIVSEKIVKTVPINDSLDNTVDSDIDVVIIDEVELITDKLDDILVADTDVKTIDEIELNTNSKEAKIEPVSEVEYNFQNERMLKDSYFTDGVLYCFQVGSFRTKSVAENISQNLQESGHKAFLVEAKPFNNEKIWYRIRIGYFDSLKEAKRYKSTIKK